MFHLLSTQNLSAQLIQQWLQRATEFKAGAISNCAAGLTAVFISDRPSLRTRASFGVGFETLGGKFHSFQPNEIGFGERESAHDIGGVLGSYYDLIVARVLEPTDLEVLASASGVPVINALSKTEHPAQCLSDIFTMSEYFKQPSQLQCVYVGDASNVARSLATLCNIIGWQFTLIGPAEYHFTANEAITCTTDWSVITCADVVYTDIWTSMGQEAENAKRLQDFADYRLTLERFNQAKPTAIFMNDMPIRRGVEIDDAVVDGPHSVIFTQAKNRLYMQMAIMEYCLTH